MRDEGEDTLKAALEPPQAEVERVVAAALAARPGDAHRGARWTAFAAAVALIAILVTDARRERPFTELLPVSAGGEVTSKVSNFGTVMLVEGGSGRTLVASGGIRRESVEQQSPYRLMIAKGTVP